MTQPSTTADRWFHRLWLLTISVFLIIGLPLLAFAGLLAFVTAGLLVGDGGGWEALTGAWAAIIGALALVAVGLWFLLRWAAKHKPVLGAAVGAITGVCIGAVSVAHLLSVFERTTPVDLLELTAVAAVPWAAALTLMSLALGIRATTRPAPMA